MKEYIEAEFSEGMTWDNKGEWHIDHKRPISSFDLLINTEIQKCWYWDNLQPMWGRENIIKSNKWDGEFPWYKTFRRTVNVYKTKERVKNKDEIVRIYRRIVSSKASTEDKQIYQNFLSKQYFSPDYVPVRLGKYKIPQLEMIRDLKYSLGGDMESAYTQTIDDNRLVLLRRLFNDLGIDPMAIGSSYGDTFVSLEKIKALDSELLTILGAKKGGKVKSEDEDNVKRVRSIVKSLFLNFERIETTCNKKHVITGYKFVDKGGIWKAIR